MLTSLLPTTAGHIVMALMFTKDDVNGTFQRRF